MAPRLRLLLLLLPAGCAAPGDREAAAMRSALESSQASLVAVAPPSLPGQPTAPGQDAASARPVPRLVMARREFRQPAAEAVDQARERVQDRTGSRPASAAELLGAGPDTLRQWLGEPVLRRPEGSAEVWLYAGAGCALDLILYPAGPGLTVAHAAARAQGAEPRTEAACLGGIAAAQDGRPIPTASPAGTGATARPVDRGA